MHNVVNWNLDILGLIPRFLKMISRENERKSTYTSANDYNDTNVIHVPPRARKRIVYVNAIFELQDGSSLPNTKLDLVKLLKTNKAIPFHKWVCPVCHTIPNFERWQHQDLLTGNPNKIIIKTDNIIKFLVILLIKHFNSKLIITKPFK